jgi:hypothetical protein
MYKKRNNNCFNHVKSKLPIVLILLLKNNVMEILKDHLVGILCTCYCVKFYTAALELYTFFLRPESSKKQLHTTCCLSHLQKKENTHRQRYRDHLRHDSTVYLSLTLPSLLACPRATPTHSAAAAVYSSRPPWTHPTA